MPISGTSEHVQWQPPAGIFSSNYFYTGYKSAPTGNVRGTGDRTSATPVLAKMTNWKTLASVGAVVPLDFKPTTRVTTTDLSYDKDFFNDAVTMDEFGAILSGSSAPPPATQKWRYFEVRAVNAAGNGEWSDRIYAATEEV